MASSPSASAVLAALEAASGGLGARELARLSGYAPSTVRSALVELRRRHGIVIHSATVPRKGRGPSLKVYALDEDLLAEHRDRAAAQRRERAVRLGTVRDRRRVLERERAVTSAVEYERARSRFRPGHPWRRPAQNRDGAGARAGV